ncbi:hypothetical protein HU200_020201 [Digitaria exilis]|uniref:ENTH domain-containing protein n=1 Tax=Digitaria exilis TaxID=1010633 RepID=A0A835KD61_9POAL|nr:hypothetical protein HU200_020201 [Digitaria exilis]CAB3463663.1 unnamed protein product [Digitaria exilis]
MSIRKALGAVKDQATIGIARVSSSVKPDLDVAIVRATSHDDAPPDDRRAREVLRLAAGGSQRACVASLSRRLARTRDYVVAAKGLALLHRLAAADAEGGGDPHLLAELLRPATSGKRAGEPVLSLLLDFRDDAHAASWDHSAFVRAYAAYIDDRVRFLVSLLPPPRAVHFADDHHFAAPAPPPPAAAAVSDMDAEGLLLRARQLRHLLDRFLACRPAGLARTSRVVLATLYPLLRESFTLYRDVAGVLAAILDRFFDGMEYPECVKAFETYVATAKQIDALIAFYAWCHDAGVAPSSDFPEVKRVDDELLETLEQFLREQGQAARRSISPPVVEVQSLPDHQDEIAMDGVKALPFQTANRSMTTTKADDQPRKADLLVDLREPAATVDEQENKLALALFSAAPPPATTTTGSWVAFPSESEEAPAVTTSAWDTPAAEKGKADWELALVETASNLSRQTAALGGGMDTLLLGGMYDQGVVRQQVAAHQAAWAGSASSVALPVAHGAAAPVLMLPAPEGTTVEMVGGDPFAASLAVPPPSYVQMAEMERKQQLLLQEQQMWAQYRQGGMQGQPVGYNGLAAGGVFVPNAAVPMPSYGMPMAYNHVGGYY